MTMNRKEYEFEVYTLVAAIGELSSACCCKNAGDMHVYADSCIDAASKIAEGLGFSIDKFNLATDASFDFSMELKGLLLSAVGLLGCGTLANTKTRLHSIVKSALRIKRNENF